MISSAAKSVKRNDKPKFTRRKDGRWQKKYRGKTYYFASEAEGLRWWEGLTPQLSDTVKEQGVKLLIPVEQILPSPENDKIYGPVNTDDPNFQSLSDDIAQNGILDPLIVTSDRPKHFIKSGHRRFAAALEHDLAEVPCIVDPIRREDDVEAFTRALVSHNEQRVKTLRQKVREEIVKSDPLEAHARLVAEREEESRLKVETMDLGERKVRSKIGPLKQEMLDALLKLLNSGIKLPTSDRTLHYLLANDPPLRNTNRPDSTYKLDRNSYNDLCNLLTRARLEGTIPWEWIIDETRPVTTWGVHADPQSFVKQHLDGFLVGYYRDLLQSQSNHIEVLAEKNTVARQIRDVCAKYCLPMTSGRGFCSSRPRLDLYRRYMKSGKDYLILLIISDLDPAGMYIAESFARSMRDDFGVEKIRAIKVAITAEQVEKYGIPHGEKAKKNDKRRAEFVKRYGEYIYEVEALPDREPGKLLDESVRSVLDLEAYNYEVEQEAQDAAEMEASRRQAMWALEDMGLTDEDDD